MDISVNSSTIAGRNEWPVLIQIVTNPTSLVGFAYLDLGVWVDLHGSVYAGIV